MDVWLGRQIFQEACVPKGQRITLNIKVSYISSTWLTDKEIKTAAKALVGLDESFDALEETTDSDRILERLTNEEYRCIVTGYETGVTNY